MKVSRYICYRPYKGGTLSSLKTVDIPTGTVLRAYDHVIHHWDIPVCIDRSQIGQHHFAIDDDGRGIERGNLAYAIAFAERVRHGANDAQQRFTDEELETLQTRWSQFIRPDSDYVLFTDDFFEQSPELLAEIAEALHIEVENGRTD